jgi:hypothetical protein
MTSGPADPGMELQRLLDWVGTYEHRNVLVTGTGAGKTAVATRAFARAIAEAADVSGAARRGIKTFSFSHWLLWSVFHEARCPRDSDWDVDWSGYGAAGLSLEWLVAGVCGGRTVRSVDPTTYLLATVASTSAIAWFRVVDPVEALLRSLQRLIRLGRRADASRQLAVQRLRFACRAARSSPDVPPGEVVVSSSRVPRGPDLSRVISAVVDHSRVSGPT